MLDFVDALCFDFENDVLDSGLYPGGTLTLRTMTEVTFPDGFFFECFLFFFQNL
jgi:hypothetical protein